jgi:hypothetical protein
MIEKLTRLVDTLVPFLAAYPSWVRVTFSLWVLLSAVLLLGLLLARQPDARRDVPESTGNARNSMESKPMQEDASTSRDAWLIITGVRIFGLDSSGEPRVRVTATVNGVRYTYPSGTEAKWVRLGPDMSNQRFLLPPTKEGYNIRFSMEGVYQEQPFKMISQSEKFVKVKSIPFEGSYSLHSFDLNTGSRSGSADGSVLYVVTSDPDHGVG